MRYLKSVILCLLLLAIPLKGFAAARMIFCGGHGDAMHAPEALQGHSAHHNAPLPDASGGGEQPSNESAPHAADDPGCWDCHCSVCAACCTAAGMTSPVFLLGSFLEASRSRPFSNFSHFKGRIPATLERPPLAPRSTRVA
ncbi:MAG: hypothetical protein ACKVQU_11530 [Burkholderiales bacterium]